MASAFVKSLFNNQNKIASTSIALTGSLSVAVGNVIFVGLAIDDTASAFTCTDNLGNTYTVDIEGGFGGVKSVIYRAPITTGGTLTTITPAWTTSTTAKAARSFEASDVGTLKDTGSNIATATTVECLLTADTLPADGFAVYMGGWEAPSNESTWSTPASDGTTEGTTGTTGGGAATNVTCHLCWDTSAVDEAISRTSDKSVTTRDASGIGATYFKTTPVDPVANWYPKKAIERSFKSMIGR